MLRIAQPQSPADFDDLRALLRDYRDFLLSLEPPHCEIAENSVPAGEFTAFLARLEQEHSPPGRAMLLARLGGAAVGCGMYRTLAPGTAEIKRVYVRDAARGQGAGLALMQALVDRCRAAGFSRILMDSGTPLAAAKRLYLSMGFRLRGPYQDVPEAARPHLIFFQMDL